MHLSYLVWTQPTDQRLWLVAGVAAEGRRDHSGQRGSR